MAGRISRRTVATSTCEIDVVKNEDYEEFPSGKRDFLDFRYYLDVLKNSDVAHDQFKKCIETILQYFWSRNIRAVAACDFEGELPKHALGT
jgi:hypothetical protein